MRLRLATRGSALAWGQSQLVAEALRDLGHDVELVKVVTHGDVSTAPLAAIGGSGVFVGAVRAAVLAGDADLAVHSFKDLPTGEAPGLIIAAVPPREDPADALCSGTGDGTGSGAGLTLAQLPTGARVGTGSARRGAQLRELRGDLEIVDIRGNVETRLSRAGADLDAVVLAAAGLRRLGLEERITERFPPESFLPAPAQGALAVECRADAPVELRTALASLDDAATRLAALAERAVLERLNAGCAAPVGAFAHVEGDDLHLTAAVTHPDGGRRLRESGTARLPAGWGRAAPGTTREAPGKTSGELRRATGTTAAHDVPAVALDHELAQQATELGYLLADRLLASGAAELVDLTARKPGPLTGRRILIPQRWYDSLGDRLVGAGAEIVAAAFTATEPLPTEALETELVRAGYDWLVVTSSATVPALMATGGPQAYAQMRVAAVGPATAKALASAGFTVALVASQPGGAGLAADFPRGPGRVLAPGAEDASVEPAAGLRAKGWAVTQVPVYRTVAMPLSDTVVTDWQAGRFDAFVVTAGSVARSAVSVAGLPGPPVVAIGEPSATASAAVGLVVAAVATRPDADALAAAVARALT